MSTTAAQQLDSAKSLASLWSGLLPDYPLPEQTQFLRWAAMGPEEIAVYVLNRTARKARREQMSVGCYVSGLILNEREGGHHIDGGKN